MKNRNWIRALLLLAGIGLACGQGTAVSPQAAGREAAANMTWFTDDAFRLPLPDWQEVDSDDPNTLIAVAENGRALALARHELIPRLVARHLTDNLPDYGDFYDLALDDSAPGRAEINGRLGGDVVQQVRFIFVYCAGATYQLTGSAPEDDFASFEPLLDQVEADARCAERPQRAPHENGLVGLIINPPGDDYAFPNFRAAVFEARTAGVQATHTYLPWAEIEKTPGEYDWLIGDYLLDVLTLEGLRLSLVLDFIHTSVPGQTPPDLAGKSFADPVYVERAAAFSAAVAQRYGDQLDYLALGNEVNIYLADHPADLEPYLAAFMAMRTAVHAVRPDLPVGTTLAFHEAMSSGRYDLIDAFKTGDFLAYTYYPHTAGFRYDGDTNGFGAALDEMTAVSGDTPFMILENGWATAESLGGSEMKQDEYLRATFAALAENRDRFGRHLWFNLHDGTPEGCAEAALSFVPEGFDTAAAGESWGFFEDYLCTLGLKQNDGTPKQGWHTFQSEMAAYLD